MGEALLTRKLHKAIVATVQAGNYRKHAAAAAGVSESAVKRWMALGQREDAKDPYRAFAADILRAENVACCDAVTCLTETAQTDYRAALEFLKRKFPSEWGDTAKRDARAQIAIVLECVEHVLTKGDARRVFEEIARRNGDGEGASPERAGSETRH